MKSTQLELLSDQPEQDAVAYFSDAPREARGAVHTRREVAEFILDLVGWDAGPGLSECRLLEPACGDGDFLVPVTERLLASVPSDDVSIAHSVCGIEVNTDALAACRKQLSERFEGHGWSAEPTRTVLDTWLVQADFLTARLDAGFTHVVGNPPYIRLEGLPKELLRLYRERWRSLFDRADLYVAFIEKSLGLLAGRGRLGFICADRWMKNRYGGPIRAMVADGFHLESYVDFTGCPAFDEEVDAYPAVTVIRRGPGSLTRVAFRPEVSREGFAGLARALRGETAHDAVGLRSGVCDRDNPWAFDEKGEMEIIRRLERAFLPIESVGCQVGIGVATGADAVFIGTEEQLDVEPERRLPLVTTKDIQTGRVSWGGLWVLNPFGPDGKLVDPEEYPRFRSYITRHREALRRRNVAARNPNGWFRTIDRIHAWLTGTPKLLVPDIKGSAHVVLESGSYYPHHNLYYITSSEWPLEALQVVLGSPVARAFVAAYSPQMRGGFLRFQAQYLRRIRLPDWRSVEENLRRELVEAHSAADRSRHEELVRRVYSLSARDWNRLAVKRPAA